MLNHNAETLPPPNQRNKREQLSAIISDLVSDFMYYNRKEDEEFPRMTIENMIEDGEVSIDEITDCFRANLLARMADH